MAATVAPYARPDIVRGEQCAEARLGHRRSDRAADCRGGGRPVLGRGAPRSPCCWAVLGCCSPTRRLPGGASSRHPASGVVAVVGNARTPAVASVAGPRPACGVHPPGFIVRCPARPVSGHLVSSSRVRRSGRTGWTPDGWTPDGWTPSVRTRPTRPPQAVALGTRPVRRGTLHHGHGSRSRWAAAPSSSPGVGRGRPGRGRRCRARASVSGVGGGPRPGWVRAAALARCPARQARLALGAPVAGGCGRQESRCQREVAAPAAWLPSSGWVGDHGGWWSWRLTRGWMGPEGPMGVPAGMGVRPQRGPGRQPALPGRRGSAVTCGDGWWACQDLNLGPHPYQLNAGNRCAHRRFCRSRVPVGACLAVAGPCMSASALRAGAERCTGRRTPPTIV
jgi:hypothetical protein